MLIDSKPERPGVGKEGSRFNSLDEKHSIKVCVSVRNRIRLSTAKMFKRKNVADMVEEALNEYFERHPELLHSGGKM